MSDVETKGIIQVLFASILGIWTVLTGRVHKRINAVEKAKLDKSAFIEFKEAEASRHKDTKDTVLRVEKKMDHYFNNYRD